MKKSRKVLSVTFGLLWLSLFLFSATISVSIITWLLGMTSGWIPIIAVITTGLILYAAIEVSNMEDELEKPHQLEC